MTTGFEKREAAKAAIAKMRTAFDSDAPELLVDVQRAEMHLYGRVGPSESGGVSARMFAEALTAMGGKDFSLFINSPGGFVDQGWAIGNQIERYAGNVTGVCDGLAASIASYVLVCCDTRLIAPSSAVMIHNASALLQGTEAQLKKEAALLAKFSASIHAKYVLVTKQPADQIQRWMDEETWFFGSEAIDAGFCSGYFGKPADFRPRLAAAKRAALHHRIATLRDENKRLDEGL